MGIHNTSVRVKLIDYFQVSAISSTQFRVTLPLECKLGANFIHIFSTWCKLLPIVDTARCSALHWNHVRAEQDLLAIKTVEICERGTWGLTIRRTQYLSASNCPLSATGLIEASIPIAPLRPTVSKLDCTTTTTTTTSSRNVSSAAVACSGCGGSVQIDNEIGWVFAILHSSFSKSIALEER